MIIEHFRECWNIRENLTCNNAFLDLSLSDSVLRKIKRLEVEWLRVSKERWRDDETVVQQNFICCSVFCCVLRLAVVKVIVGWKQTVFLYKSLVKEAQNEREMIQCIVWM